MLRTRVISGAILLALVLLIAWARGPLLTLGIGVAAVIAVLEFCGMARVAGYKPHTVGAALLTLGLIVPAALTNLAPLLASLSGSPNLSQLWQITADATPGLVDTSGFLLIMAALPLLLLAYATPDKKREPWPASAWQDIGLTVGGALYVGGLLRYALLLNRPPGEGWWILLVIFGTAAADTGAYFSGRAFGKRKMIPHISPGKTWAGFWGGQIACILVVALMGYVMSIPWFHVPLLGIAIGVASVVGDLCESLLKRGFGVKDSGHSIPGHGGLLDRLDSILFVLTVVYFYANLFYS